MLSDEVFYSTFRDLVLSSQQKVHPPVEERLEEKQDCVEGDNENNNEQKDEDTRSDGVKFMFHQMKMLPESRRHLYWNMMRAFPTSPLYLMLGIGALGTNIAR